MTEANALDRPLDKPYATVARPFASKPFRVGDYVVRPKLNILSRPDGETHLEPKVMAVLVLLAERAGEAVSKEDIVRVVWRGASVSDDALVRCISELRKALGDSPKNQNVIQTIPKMGYRLIASVLPMEQELRAKQTSWIKLTLDAVLASCSDHIYVYDREERWIYASDAGAAAIGLTAKDIVGKTWRELGMPKEILEPFFRQVGSVFEGGDSVRAEVSYPVLTGIRYFEYILDPMLDDDGDVVAVVAFVRDVTEQRHSAEEVRRLRGELETAEQGIVRAFLPSCAGCDKIRAPSGQWVSVDALRERLPKPVAENCCPDCDPGEHD